MKNFKTWLLSQTYRNDPIGDLADDVKRDTKSWKSVKGLRNSMIEWRACREAYETLDEAVEEYKSLNKRYPKLYE